MTTDRRREQLAEVFELFSQGGPPLDPAGIVPLGKVLRGQSWDPALAPTLLGRMDLDRDGAVGEADFVEFISSKLRDVTDDEFERCCDRFREAAEATPAAARPSVSMRAKLAAGVCACVAPLWVLGYKTEIMLTGVCLVLAWLGWARFHHSAAPTQASEVAEPRTRGRKGKKAPKKKPAARGAALRGTPEGGTVGVTEQELQKKHCPEQEQEQEQEEQEECSSSDEEYDLGLLLGQGTQLAARKPRANQSQKPKPKPKQNSTSSGSWRAAGPPHSEAFEHQDWNSVGWNNAAAHPKPSGPVSSKGGAVGRKLSQRTFVALDEATEADHVSTVSLSLSLRIQRARQARKMKQAELAKLINEKPEVVNKYESGKAVPDNLVLGKLEKALGAKLRGKK